jgi:zinc transport system substrate-binding protein
VRKVYLRIAIFVGIVAAAVFAGCSFAEPVDSSAKKIRVVTTIFPLYDFVRQVGGDRVNVVLLVPPGVEPHTFEPTPSDFVTINSADIFLYTSDAMEPWVERLLPTITNQNLLVVMAYNSIRRAVAFEESPGNDPHIWLNFVYDQHIVDDIVNDLISFDENGREGYLDRGRAYKSELAHLHRSYMDGLKQCRLNTIYLGGHSAFQNWAMEYSIVIVSPYKGFAADAEPTPKAIASLIEGIRSSGAKTVFYEELLDPKVARIVEEETGAKITLLSAAHNVTAEEMSQQGTFLKIMEGNLIKLRSALECP